MSDRPTKLVLRYYSVGFGDCLLLTFQYAERERSVLIDFGSTSPPGSAQSGDLFLRIARDVESRCGGKLDAVVATHRHKDHIDGFRRKSNGTGSGDVIARCKPDLVLLPWTEDPKLETDAREPIAGMSAARSAVRGLQGMQAMAGAVLAETERVERSLFAARARQLRFLGEDNLTNRAALESLWKMGEESRAGSCRFLHYGAKSGLEPVLPGVRVKVLGPPSIAQHPEVLRQSPTDDEYWHLLGLAGARTSRARAALFRGYCAHGRVRPEHRWIRQRLDRLRSDQLLEVVRTVDKAINNTSLILLFAIGRTKLLFPGDAQIENWQYALKRHARMLRGVRLYKVGHHGSLNATPKSLWAGFDLRSEDADDPTRFVSVLSTKAGVHGHANEVPRQKLVDELTRWSDVRSTQALAKRKKLYGEVELDL